MWNQQLKTPYLFFTGKGGVGKTSLACATALGLAETGKRTLIVSTDPASNLDEVFETPLSPSPTAITGVPNLFAANLDPDAAATAYRENLVAPYRGKLPPAVIRQMEEQLSGACSTEIATFNEFVRLLADDEVRNSFDHIVFDTAPTGHTLRLLSLPSAWSEYLNTSTSESSCLGPLAGLQAQREIYERALERLKDGSMTTVVLVARPDKGSLKEANRTLVELSELRIQNVRLLINACYQPAPTEDSVANSFYQTAQSALNEIPSPLANIASQRVPLKATNVVGLEAVRLLLSDASTAPTAVPVDEPFDGGESLSQFVDGLVRTGNGVVMTMGKGGVGKTTVACLIAKELAQRGFPVHLTTTDPAGNLRDVLGEATPNLQVSQIDPVAEVKAYQEKVLNQSRELLDADGLALLEEDLRSPCTEEIAVFQAFAEVVAGGTDQFVVIDTAPTGHSLLLLDATEAYHREVLRTPSGVSPAVSELLGRLRDPDFTHIVLVTLPEPTPVHEATRLSKDLARAGIGIYGWIVNRCLSGLGVSEPILAGKARQEAKSIQEVLASSERVTIIPWRAADK